MATVKDIKKKAQQAKIEGYELTPTEIKLITDLNFNKQRVINEFASIGQLEATVAIKKEDNLKLFKQNSELEIQLSKTLTAKYGDGRIDIDNKLFIPIQG